MMLHSGFFLGRTTARLRGIVRGQKMADFFEKLTTRKLATRIPAATTRPASTTSTTALYDAIGQRDVRFRKRMALARALERLMILDHVIAHREFHWLGPKQDKVAHFPDHDVHRP